MKKILILILIIVLGGVWYFSTRTVKAPPTNSNQTSGNFKPDASNATFTFDDESVTLTKGLSEETDASVGLVTETELLDKQAFGDLNADGKDDAVVFLARSGGGSGTFVYAAAYVSGPISYKGTGAIFLGDRVAPSSITVANGIATVTYLDRKSDEPFSAEPTVKVTKQFVYQNGEFVEK